MNNKKVFQNAKWIIWCKITQSVIQLIVGMISARYLGPSNYGLINYAASVVAFAIPVMQLGLQSTLVQEYVDKPSLEGQILGTSIMMNIVSGLACIVGVTLFAKISNPEEETTIVVCFLYSISLIFQGVEMIEYWFQAKLLSKYSSLAMLCSYVVVSAYKIVLLSLGKGVIWFTLSYAIQYGVTGLLLLIVYAQKSPQRLGVSFQLARELLKKSKYYIIPMLMVVLYNRTGNIMLKQLYSETENGFYATAVACVSITGFVYNAIIDTARPVVLQSMQQSRAAFEKNICRVYSIITWLSLVQSVIYTVFSDQIIVFLYGNAYLPSGSVLRIFVWSTAFSYMGYVRNIWILGEQKHQSLFKINLCGVVVNLILNVCLIPCFGACGAAAASVFTQFVTNFLLGFFMKELRTNNQLLLKGLNPKVITGIMTKLKDDQSK